MQHDVCSHTCTCLFACLFSCLALYTCIQLSQLSYAGRSVGRAPAQNAVCHGFESHPVQSVFSLTAMCASKLKILQIIMWNIGMAQKAKETRSGCLVHIVQ